jgi:C-terminal processing protease CtpA/Prc
LKQRDDERGATIAQVYPAGPAARAGLQPGDVIQQINGHQVANGNDLVSALDQQHPGEKAELNILRNDEQTKLTATLGSRNSFVSNNRQTNRFGGRESQYDENEDMQNFPIHTMELEHNRRNAEQHQRIENEIAQLREEIRQLRETLQRR